MLLLARAEKGLEAVKQGNIKKYKYRFKEISDE